MQPEGAKLAIRVLFGGVPAAAFMTAFILMTRFRLDESQHREIQRELAARVENRAGTPNDPDGAEPHA